MSHQLRDNTGLPAIRSDVIARAGVRVGRRYVEYVRRDQEQNIRVIGLAHYPSKQSSATGSKLLSNYHRSVDICKALAKRPGIDVYVQWRNSQRRVPVRLGSISCSVYLRKVCYTKHILCVRLALINGD